MKASITLLSSVVDPDPHGSGTRKVQTWIRNKSFRIHNTAHKYLISHEHSLRPLDWIPTDKSDGQGFCEELALNLDGILDNLVDALLAWLVHQVAEHQAGKVRVQTLVPAQDIYEYNIE